jgi:hypothetical protein
MPGAKIVRGEHRLSLMRDLWSTLNAELGGVHTPHQYGLKYLNRMLIGRCAPIYAPINEWEAFVRWLHAGLERGLGEKSAFKLAKVWGQIGLYTRPL